MTRLAPSAGDELEECRDDLSDAHEQIGHLQTALQSAREIGCAVGILMAGRKIRYEDGFELLVRASHRSRRKVREVAQDVIHTGDLPV